MATTFLDRCLVRYFNPRTREGCDWVTGEYRSYREISSHAPARGATGKELSPFPVIIISIHAPARGATFPEMATLADLLRLVFQSTHPRGVRPASGDVSLPSKGFQSTHPRGVRPSSGVRPVFHHISIHAPARGATRLFRRHRSACGITINFNPRTREGCDMGIE